MCGQIGRCNICKDPSLGLPLQKMGGYNNPAEGRKTRMRVLLQRQ
jgi:hypothetical protein